MRRLAVLALLAGACHVPSRDTFWVAPGGDDAAGGSSDRPFATLGRARDAVRAVNRGAGDYTVIVRGGAYRLDAPLALDARDGGGEGHLVTWRAADGETPILSGGVPATAANVVDARQLYVDDARLARRRDPVAGGVAFADSDQRDARAGYHFSPAELPSWAGPTLAELGWTDTFSHKVCPVAAVEPAADGGIDVVVAQPCFYLVSHDPSGRPLPAPAYAEQRFDALPAGGEVIAPATEQLLTITGTLDAPVRNLALVGLGFAHAAWRRPAVEGLPDVQDGFVVDLSDPSALWQQGSALTNVHNELRKPDAAVVVDASTAITFDRCRFVHLGGAGISIQHGASGVVVRGSTFEDISASAVQLGDVRRDDHHPADPRLVVHDNAVVANSIHDIGVELEDSVAVFVGYTAASTVSDNDIARVPYTGISVGWGWGEEDPGGGATTQPFSFTTPTTARDNLVRDNRLTAVMQRRSDGGAIYTLGAQPGTLIDGNVVRGAIGFPGGIYLDEGSRGITIGTNDVTDVPLPLFDHSGT